MEQAPNCYECTHRREVPGSAHSRCNNHDANVDGDVRGIKGGWFLWPFNFDPVWLKSCDGFSTDDKDKDAPLKEGSPLQELMSIMGKRFVGR